MVYEYHQDDPKKCTGLRLIHLRYADRLRSPRQIPRHAIILNPAATRILSPSDTSLGENHGIVALDCSWNLAQQVFKHTFHGENRRLPFLLAGNPVNYTSLGKLCTVEALAAGLDILGHTEQSNQILSLFKWGPTFHTLNRELLDTYAENDPRETADLEAALLKTRSRE